MVPTVLMVACASWICVARSGASFFAPWVWASRVSTAVLNVSWSLAWMPHASAERPCSRLRR
ncbi:hypothetical protein D3C71_2001640 [compost metagenome]